MKYEKTREDKQRRKYLPKKEARQILSDNSFTRYSNRVMAVLHEVSVRIKKIAKSNNQSGVSDE